MIESQYLYTAITGQTITAAANSTNTIDQGTVSTTANALGSVRDLGVGNSLYVVTCVVTAFTTGSNTSLAVVFQTCATVGGTYLPIPVKATTPAEAISFGAAGSANALGSGLSAAGAVSGQGGQLLYSINGTTAAGTVFIAALNPGAWALEFSRLRFVPLTADLTGGAVVSFITTSLTDWRGFQSGYSV